MNKKIVVDTNVFIAALLSPEGNSRKVLRKCFQGNYKPLMGSALYWEYEDVMTRQEIKARCLLNTTEVSALLNTFMKVCQWTAIYYLWRPNLKDENDNHILELAIAGNASTIVTHNLKDFNRSELMFPAIEIVSPNQLLASEGE
jgi:putative PIN family toxin of toxin-antitoxin system